MRLNYIFNYSYVTNEKESYFTYSLYDPRIVSRCSISALGQIQQLTCCDRTSLDDCKCLRGFKPNRQSDWDLQIYSGLIKPSLVIAIVSIFTGLPLVVFGYYLWKKTLGKKREHRNRYGVTINKLAAGGEKNDAELPIFGLRAIIAATNNFAEANKLGEGGFGPVYKVTLPLCTLDTKTFFSSCTLLVYL
ncbi:unnamed protein product [Malus baccata var. baccata]